MATAATTRLLKAVVIGGTGATGKCLLGELVTASAFDEVVSLGRREAAIPDRYDVTNVSNKLKHEIVDFDLEKFTVESAKSYFEGKDVVFCCLGTTRAAAKRMPGNTSDNFRRIDFELVVRSAEIAKAAGVRHFSLVSSQGSNANSWFLYMKTKGEAENGIEALGFERAALWKPGLLQRGEERRFAERVFGLFMSSMPVWDLALAMRFEAEQFAYGKAEFPKCSRYNNADIRAFCATAQKEAANSAAESQPASDPAPSALSSEKKEEEAVSEDHGKDEEVEKKGEDVQETEKEEADEAKTEDQKEEADEERDRETEKEETDETKTEDQKEA